MALDNAEFISELSIVDPPGTDPLNQGDDHIRTTKKAVQQSFPNVGSAVPQTGAQMAQMAIKNEANVFTQTQTLGLGALAQSGTVANPSYAFTAHPDMGMYRETTNVLGLATEGALRLRITAQALRVFSLQVRSETDGFASGPSYSWQIQTNMGMYRPATDQIGFSTNNTDRLRIKNNGLEVMVGQVGAPSYSFLGDNDTGMFNIQPNSLVFATAGVARMTLSNIGALTMETGGILMNDASGTQTATLNYRRGGLNRWRLVMRSDASDNDFEIVRHNAAGSQLDIPVTIENDTGFIILATLPTTNPGGTGRLWKSSGFVAIT